MDPIGIISVIGSTLVGLGGVAITSRNGRQTLVVERERRVQVRLADSCLEILRRVEDEALWVNAEPRTSSPEYTNRSRCRRAS